VSFNPDTQGRWGQSFDGDPASGADSDRWAGSSYGVLDAFWGPGQTDIFDPRVLYDPSHQRWLTVAIANPATNDSSLLLAVSQTMIPPAIGSATRFAWI
jgi:hypothetical protein